MTSTLLPASSLCPSFTQTALSPSPVSSDAILLGQERAISAFELLRSTTNQHMYLADFNGLDRKLLIKALAHRGETPSNQYLVAAKSTNNDVELVWHNKVPGEEIGVLAEKNQTFAYLSGNIRRSDLIGQMSKTAKSSRYQGGALANCHYLFICAESLYKREGLWELIFDTLAKGYYRVSSELERIPLACKIILVGNINLYSQIYQLESQFSYHFPLLGELAHEIDLSQHRESAYLDWAQAIAHSQALSLAESVVLPLLTYGAKLTEHQHRLSLCSATMVQVLAQAKFYTKSTQIDAAALNKALAQINYRHNAQETLSSQNFEDKFINLATTGSMVGQVNGLTVIDMAEYAYGEPARITTSVHYGDGEVADIERKSELGGNIHAKGMMILSACLYRIFGKDAPLHLNANIVFEQSYQEIDGDSASLAEYACLISAIAEQPISQSLAITGALDQFGNVQAIGGVNEKITGFFNLCAKRGLTGEQGVIIPSSNTQQLNLPVEIINAVEKGMFHIHQVSHMDEAIELVMQKTAGEADENNDFPEESIYGMVQHRLDKLAGETEEEMTFFEKMLTKLRFFSN